MTFRLPLGSWSSESTPSVWASLSMTSAILDAGHRFANSASRCLDRCMPGSCDQRIDLLRPGEGLARLPIPVSTRGIRSAPYLTATLCVTRDPESGVQNMGTYRGALKAQDRLGVRMSSRPGGAGGYLHWRKYQKAKRPMPCAIVIGCAPVVLFTGPQKLPVDQDEMAVAGGLAGDRFVLSKAYCRPLCPG